VKSEEEVRKERIRTIDDRAIRITKLMQTPGFKDLLEQIDSWEKQALQAYRLPIANLHSQGKYDALCQFKEFFKRQEEQIKKMYDRDKKEKKGG
jgi:hypothetical protein